MSKCECGCVGVWVSGCIFRVHVSVCCVCTRAKQGTPQMWGTLGATKHVARIAQEASGLRRRQRGVGSLCVARIKSDLTTAGIYCGRWDKRNVCPLSSVACLHRLCCLPGCRVPCLCPRSLPFVPCLDAMFLAFPCLVPCLVP